MGPVQKSCFCRVPIRFETVARQKHDSDSKRRGRVVPNSCFLKPRNNSNRSNAIWPKYINVICEFCLAYHGRSTTFESLPCQSRVARQSLLISFEQYFLRTKLVWSRHRYFGWTASLWIFWLDRTRLVCRSLIGTEQVGQNGAISYNKLQNTSKDYYLIYFDLTFLLDARRKLGFLGKEGYDIFAKNKLFPPRVRWEALESKVEDIKTAAESYQKAFNDIMSTVKNNGDFKQVSASYL